MEQEILEKYEVCIRFDEGALYRSGEYESAAADAEKMKKLIADIFGEPVLPLLEEYTSAIYAEMELEAQHYFEQGYRMKE